MHFNMNIISITAIAALLLASIESAESMGLFSNKVVYQGLTITGKGAFGDKKLELVKVLNEKDPVDYIEAEWDGKPATVICADLSRREGRMTKFFYTEHTTSNYPGPVDPQAREGAKHFSNVLSSFTAFARQCYVVKNVCKYTYHEHVRNLKKKDPTKDPTAENNVKQIVEAIKYVQAKRLLYIFSHKNICFDAKENLLILRKHAVVSIDQAEPDDLMQFNSAVFAIIYCLLERPPTIPVDSRALDARVRSITGSLLYPIAPLSSPSGSRRSSMSSSRRGSISSIDPLPLYEP